MSAIHNNVAAGDTLTLVIGGRVRAIQIITLPLRRGPASEAQTCYADLSQAQVIDAGTQ